MRVALVSLRTLPRHPDANRREVETQLARIAPWKPDLVCLPECTLTGYLYRGEDLKRFSEPVPGDSTNWFGALAGKYALYLCASLLERASAGFFSSALLFDREGRLVLHYRKVEEKPPFLPGDSFVSADTPLGRLGILLCGDLFNERIRRRLHGSVDWLLVPLARSFDGRSPDAACWEREERRVYLEAVQAMSVTTFLVNALEVGEQEAAFGGAMIVGADGRLLAEALHGTSQILLWDTDHENLSLL